MNFLSNKLHGLVLCFAIAVPAAGKPPFLIEKPAEMQCDIKNKEGCDYTFKIIQILEEFMQNNTEPCVVIQ